jgi:hypothetical protein
MISYWHAHAWNVPETTTKRILRMEASILGTLAAAVRAHGGHHRSVRRYPIGAQPDIE